MMPDWVRALIEAATPHIPADFVGVLEINVDTNSSVSVAVRQSWARRAKGSKS